jgi:hypothetical protein
MHQQRHSCDRAIGSDNERWRVTQVNRQYLISTSGRVKNNRTGKIIKPFINHGYSVIDLPVNKMKKHFLAHRLVAIAFIRNTANKTMRRSY